MPLRWRENELEQLLDLRVNQLFKSQYTNKTVRARDIIIDRIRKEDPIIYLMARTMLRPRDIIMFFNNCIDEAEGKSKINQSMVINAEKVYSHDRLIALTDEWKVDYKNLEKLCRFLKQYPNKFKIEEVLEKIENSMYEFLTSSSPPMDDFIKQIAEEKYNNDDIAGFLQEMLKILFRVGVIGIKFDSYASVAWSYVGEKSIDLEINENSVFYIHPAFWNTLGIKI